MKAAVSKTFELSVSGAVEAATATPEPEDSDGPTPVPTLRGMGGMSRGGAAAQTPFGAWQGTPDRTQRAMTQEGRSKRGAHSSTHPAWYGGHEPGGAAAQTPFGAWQATKTPEPEG